MVASDNGYQEIVSPLLSKGVDINALSESQITALSGASSRGFQEVEDLQVKAGVELKLGEPDEELAHLLETAAVNKRAEDPRDLEELVNFINSPSSAPAKKTKKKKKKVSQVRKSQSSKSLKIFPQLPDRISDQGQSQARKNFENFKSIKEKEAFLECLVCLETAEIPIYMCQGSGTHLIW